MDQKKSNSLISPFFIAVIFGILILFAVCIYTVISNPEDKNLIIFSTLLGILTGLFSLVVVGLKLNHQTNQSIITLSETIDDLAAKIASGHATDQQIHLGEKQIIKLPQSNRPTRDCDRLPPKILAVDDNPANLQIVGEFLRGLGAEVSLVSNGHEALSQIDKFAFELIFMDIQMPGMDGIETTKRIREKESKNRRTPIVALTAHEVADEKSRLLLSGIDDYISKPVNENQLKQMMSRWLSITQKEGTHNNPLESKNDLNTVDVISKASATSNVESRTCTKPVDINLCLKLTNNKPQLAKDMLSMLIDSLKQDWPVIKKIYQEKNFEQLEELIHKLYGGCCYCGVPNLMEISGRLDKQLQANETDSLEETVNQLNDAIQQLLQWAEEYDIEVMFDETSAEYS